MTHQIVGTDVHEAFWIISNLQKSHFQGGKDLFLQSSTGPKKHATSLLQGSRGTPLGPTKHRSVSFSTALTSVSLDAWFLAAGVSYFRTL